MHNPHVDSTQIQYVFQVLRAAFSDHWNDTELSLSLKNGCNVVSGIKKATKGIACNNRDRIAIGFLPKFGTQAEGLWRGAWLRRVAAVAQWFGRNSVELATRANWHMSARAPNNARDILPDQSPIHSS